MAAVILASCATSNDVVSNRSIQKRKYMKGYHVDFGKKQSVKSNEATNVVTEEDRADVNVVESVKQSSSADVTQKPEMAGAVNSVQPNAASDASKAAPEAPKSLYAANVPTTAGSDSEATERQEVQLSKKRKASSSVSTNITFDGSGASFAAATDLKKTGLILLVVGLVAAVIGIILAAGSAVSGSAGGFGIAALISWLGWLAFVVGLILLIVYLIQN